LKEDIAVVTVACIVHITTTQCRNPAALNFSIKRPGKKLQAIPDSGECFSVLYRPQQKFCTIRVLGRTGTNYDYSLVKKTVGYEKNSDSGI
jgi:hypothetical protein